MSLPDDRKVDANHIHNAQVAFVRHDLGNVLPTKLPEYFAIFANQRNTIVRNESHQNAIRMNKIIQESAELDMLNRTSAKRC